jgi:hypothetical protein
MEQTSNILAVFEAATADPASPIYFTPVATRPRRDGWTPERQRRYVAALALTGRVDRAAAIVGLSQQSAGRLRLRSDGQGFGLACCAALILARRALHARAAATEGPLGRAFFVSREAEPYETSAEPSEGLSGSLAGSRGGAIARP